MKIKIAIFLILFLSLVGCLNYTMQPVTKTDKEEKTYKEADKISKIQETADWKKLSQSQQDAQIDRIYHEGVDFWKRNKTSSEDEGYFESLDLLNSAVISYYIGSGRLGKAIPYLKISSDIAIKNYYFGYFIRYQKDLADIYLKLGMTDYARQELEKLRQEVDRIYHVNINQDPSEIDEYDLLAHLIVKNYQLDFLMNTHQPINLSEWMPEFQFLIKSFEKKPLVKGLDFRYANLVARGIDRKKGKFMFLVPTNNEFLTTYARLFAMNNRKSEAMQCITEVADNYMFLSPKDKARLSGEKLAFYQQRYNNNDKIIDNAYSRVLAYEDKKETEKGIQRLPLRFHFLAFLREAEISFLLGEHTKAKSLLDQAESAFTAADAYYKQLADAYRLADRLDEEGMLMVILKAKSLEKLGQLDSAISEYQRHIAWSEKVRQSLPVDQRQYFFRSNAREGYLGLLRSGADVYLGNKNESNFNRILLASENLRSRQLREMLRTDVGSQAVVDIQSLRRRMPSDSGILLISDLESSVLVGFLDKDRYYAELLKKDSAWDSRIFELRNALAESRDYEYSKFAELGRQIFKNIELSQIRKLYILSDGALCALPFGIFPISQNKLLQDQCMVSYLPALSLFEGKSGQGMARKLFAVADPTYNKEELLEKVADKEVLAATRKRAAVNNYIPPLPETRDEVNAIRSVFSEGAEVLLGTDASKSNVKSRDLKSYSHIHFATHGVLEGDIPGLVEPALVLSYESQEDGFLRASEVTQLKLNADMTVLSACNTGNGEYFQGEGLMGMGRAFMVAGSKQVVVSLWPVSSLATKELMIRFYKELTKNGDAVAAMTEAQRQVRNLDKEESARIERAIKIVPGAKQPSAQGKQFEGFANPYYWAPFVVISNG